MKKSILFTLLTSIGMAILLASCKQDNPKPIVGKHSSTQSFIDSFPLLELPICFNFGGEKEPHLKKWFHIPDSIAEKYLCYNKNFSFYTERHVRKAFEGIGKIEFNSKITGIIYHFTNESFQNIIAFYDKDKGVFIGEIVLEGSNFIKYKINSEIDKDKKIYTRSVYNTVHDMEPLYYSHLEYGHFYEVYNTYAISENGGIVTLSSMEKQYIGKEKGGEWIYPLPRPE